MFELDNHLNIVHTNPPFDCKVSDIEKVGDLDHSNHSQIGLSLFSFNKEDK